MGFSAFEIYMLGIQTGVFIVLILLMIRHRRLYGVEPLTWIILSFSFGLIKTSYDIIVYLILNKLDDKYEFLQRLDLIPYGLGLLMIYLFAESIYNEKPEVSRFSLIIFILGMSYSLLIYSTTLNDKDAIEQLLVIYDTLFDVFQFLSMAFVTYVFYRSLKNATNRHFIIINKYLTLATSLYTIATIVDFFRELVGFSTNLIVIFYTLSLFAIAIIYLKYPFYVFAFTDPIYSLILASNNGAMIYKADLISEEYTGQDELFMSTITALNKLFSNIIIPNEIVEEIYFRSRIAIISQKNGLFGIILARRKTRVLKETLKQILSDVVKSFPELGEKGRTVFKVNNEKILGIIARTMPFLDSNEVVDSLIDHNN